MKLEQAVRDILAGDSGVAALVAGRIRPLVGATADVRPLLTYQLAGVEPINTYTGQAAYGNATVEIGLFADTYKACAELAGEVKRVLNGKAFTTATARIAPSRLDEESDIEQATEPGTERPVFVRTQTYRMLYREL